MNINKTTTDTYLLTGIDKLDPVSVYVTNYEPGKGKVVIECYSQSWACYWGGMSGKSIEEFLVSSENDYLLDKLINGSVYQTDFDEIQKRALAKGAYICANSDAEVAMLAEDMADCFGSEWFMDLPRCLTEEYHYLSRILDSVKQAFTQTAKAA